MWWICGTQVKVLHTKHLRTAGQDVDDRDRDLSDLDDLSYLSDLSDLSDLWKLWSACLVLLLSWEQGCRRAGLWAGGSGLAEPAELERGLVVTISDTLGLVCLLYTSPSPRD